MNSRKPILAAVGIGVALGVFIYLADLNKKDHQAQNNKRSLNITIDWVPSAEYVGFFVAKDLGYFESFGFDTEVSYGSGAPSVTLQIEKNAIKFGTSTSDNVIRAIERGANFRAVFPVLRYNPASIFANTETADFLDAIKSGEVGVNVQSAVYNQFLFLLDEFDVQQSEIKTYPIGFGGVNEFINGTVASFLGYSTNHGVDIGFRGKDFKEIRFEELGVTSMGLVLLVSSESSRYSDKDLSNIYKATIEGYEWAFANPKQAANILLSYEPSLKAGKVEAAIEKIRNLSGSTLASPSYDDWLIQEGVSQASIEEFAQLVNK